MTPSDTAWVDNTARAIMRRTVRRFLIDSYKQRHWWIEQADWDRENGQPVSSIINRAQSNNEHYIARWEKKYLSLAS